MQDRTGERWWSAGAGWSLAALGVAVFAGAAVPAAADGTSDPLLQAMAGHAGYLYAISALMLTVGWIDSALMLRRHRHAGGARQS